MVEEEKVGKRESERKVRARRTERVGLRSASSGKLAPPHTHLVMSPWQEAREGIGDGGTPELDALPKEGDARNEAAGRSGCQACRGGGGGGGGGGTGEGLPGGTGGAAPGAKERAGGGGCLEWVRLRGGVASSLVNGNGGRGRAGEEAKEGEEEEGGEEGEAATGGSR